MYGALRMIQCTILCLALQGMFGSRRVLCEKSTSQDFSVASVSFMYCLGLVVFRYFQKLPCLLGQLTNGKIGPAYTLALMGVLPSAHFNCWLLFVEACQILTLRSIRSDQLDRAHQCLLAFCKTFEQLYGSECCTTNLHLHLHLKEVFLDFGPAYAFWLYSFERYNGILGDYSINSRTIESQLIRRFLLSQVVHDNNCHESKMQSNEFGR